MRVISLCPSITRLIFDLDMGHSLVGITKYCIHPPKEVEKIEKVGGTKDPNIQRIRELNPDVVLMNREENRREDWETLNEAGLRCEVSFPLTMDETVEFILETGRILGREEKAERIAEGVQKARGAIRSSPGSAKPTWAYLIWRKPWMTVNGNTYIHHLLSEAGGANVFEDHENDYPQIEAAELARANPDRIFLSSEPFPFKEKHREELAMATGLEKSRFVLVNGELLSWHGAYTEMGLYYAKGLFSGGDGNEVPDFECTGGKDPS